MKSRDPIANSPNKKKACQKSLILTRNSDLGRPAESSPLRPFVTSGIASTQKKHETQRQPSRIRPESISNTILDDILFENNIFKYFLSDFETFFPPKSLISG